MVRDVTKHLTHIGKNNNGQKKETLFKKYWDNQKIILTEFLVK